MRVIIAGSRTILEPKEVEKAVEQSPFYKKITIILCGDARGVDFLGQLYGEYHGIPVEHYPAQWNQYGKSAGYRRNEQMAQNADALILVWDGQSKGSDHMLEIAKRYNLEIYERIVK